MDVGGAFVQGAHRVWRAGVMLPVVFLAVAALATGGRIASASVLGPASRTFGLGLGLQFELASIGGGPPTPYLYAALAAAVVISLVLLGALLAGLAANRFPGLGACLTAGVSHFFPLLRLGLVAGALAWLAVAVHNVAGAAVSVPVCFFGSLILGYAEVRLVVEDRRSALGALLAGARFVRADPGTTIGLHVLNILPFAAALGVVWILVPSVLHSRGQAWWEPVGVPVFLFLIVVVQAHWAAAQMALFQDRLGASTAETVDHMSQGSSVTATARPTGLPARGAPDESLPPPAQFRGSPDGR